MSVRLNKVTKEFNIGLQTAVDFLRKNGYDDVEVSPNSKITEQQYELLQKEFSSDKGLRSEATQLIQHRQEKSKERKEATKQKRQAEEIASAKPKTSYKVVGHIELDKKGNPVRKEEPQASPKAEVQAAQPAPAPSVAPKPEEKPTPQPVETKAEKVESVETPTSQPEPKPQEQKPQPAKEPETKPQPSVEERSAVLGSEVNGAYRLNTSTLAAPKVLGKIDLSSINSSTRPRKKSREEKRRERDERNHAAANGQNASGGGDRKKRVRIGKERVDVNAVASQVQEHNGQRKGGGNNNSGQQNGGGKNKNKQKNQRKPLPVQTEVSDEEVAKQVRETLARLTNKSSKVGKGAKYRREKRDAIRQGVENEMEAQAAESKVLKLTEFVTANELATMMNVPVTQVIATCMSIGIMVSINQRMDAETINLVAEEFGFTTEYVSAEVSEAVTEIEDDEEDLVPRAPIVTVMGHVDHGKTSLLDYIRQTNVIAGEAGGITQHIGAYNVTLEDGRHVTFLDTPGHEAFTAMRARGAQVTDIAIIIIAADDDIMPQTKEAIAHATAANVPIVFAINKVDKPSANPDKIKEGLAAMNFLVEDWGGKYQSQDISAKKGIGVKELLEKVLLEAEMLDLKANPNRKATGSIIESSLDKGRGYVATVLVSNGTLHVGDIMLAGTNYGRVKAMLNERGQRVKEIGPAQAATVLGLNGAPQAGDTFHVMDTDQEAREIASKREQLAREQGLRTMKRFDLNELGRRIALGDFKEMNLIIKGDVDGSIEALSDSLIKLSTEKIQVNVIYKAVGQISESDVNMAAAADNCFIVGFQVRPSAAARKLADQLGVDIRLYSVIYDAIEEVKDAMEGMLSPEIKEEVTAQVEVRQVYHISKVGTVAGAYVMEGKVNRSNKARVIRDGIVVFTGAINALKRFKDDVKEVTTNFECGMSLVNYNDLREGDIIETFQEIEVKAKL
ncbi:MAG: translation initiation factor IF-2 [Bacteroidaceae bacterium]|nr:translation initiation factor IF-2 [Bacteroidaceae bacterium]MDY4998717.1 translation initiation factor IF-2 [Bacteroidaceae bacterium]MDY5192683.1 translation initiation factor IF-2 [Bacteroidaceae bacterium]MDY5542951.1 translation initiation factor IF-2 [Bacteroidaceae bacterium]MDY5962929.1 translation initiation factor IF-2 [Bacteroidaceae bacterium]